MNKRRSISLKKLDQSGFDHVMVVVVFIVLFALVGTWFLLQSRAAPWSGELQLGSDKTLCMDNKAGSATPKNHIDVYSCNGNAKSQKWTINEISSNKFTIQSAAGNVCVDDIGDADSVPGTKTIPTKRVYLQTYACNKADKAQVWEWENSQLENVYSHGCINDPGNSKVNNTQLIVYPCSPRTSNALWYEAALKSASSGGTSTSGGSTTSSGSTGATSSAPAMPATAPSGYTRAFGEDFNKTAALGSFDAVYGSEFGEYSGCCSTNGKTQYSSAKVLYAQNGSMFYKLHSEGSTSYAAAPLPWNSKSFKYGQYGMSVKLDSTNGKGYKIAFLLWPATNKWSNEVDFPEVDPDFTAPVRAASLNYSPSGGGENGFDTAQDNLSTGTYLNDGKYHTFLLTWTPGKMIATIDGKTVATFTGNAVPSQAMRLSLQAEGWINQGAVPSGTTDVLEVPWVYINTYN